MSLQQAAVPLSQTTTVLRDEMAAAAKRRNEAIDVIRLIAAFGIIYIHSVRSPVLDGSRDLFRFAVPFYLFASFYFQCASLRKKSDRTLPQYIWGRVRRLYFPFLAWSLIYLLARSLKRRFVTHDQSWLVRPTLQMLWCGTEYHLWFLPFLLASSILLAAIYWFLLKRDRRLRWPLIAIAIGIGLFFALYDRASTWDPIFPNPMYVYIQDWRAMPAMCWGLAFAWYMTMGPELYTVSMPLGVCGMLLCVAVSVKQAFDRQMNLIPRNVIELIPRGLSGLGAMLTALAPWTGAWVPFLAKYGRYSYGIYLCHVFIAEFVRTAVDHLGNRLHLADPVAIDLMNFLLTLFGSVAVVLILGRSKKTAWLNG